MPDERFSLGERNPWRQGHSVKELLRSTTCFHYISDDPLKLKINSVRPPWWIIYKKFRWNSFLASTASSRTSRSSWERSRWVSKSLVQLQLIFIFSGRGVHDHHLLCRTWALRWQTLTWYLRGKYALKTVNLSGTILNWIFYIQHNLELPVPERKREITIVLLLFWKASSFFREVTWLTRTRMRRQL